MKSGIDAYEDDSGEHYHGTAHTLSLAYLSANVQATPGPRSSRWSLALGGSRRELSAAFELDAPDMLLTDTVGPATFSDDTGAYTRRYTYELATTLDGRHVDGEKSISAPWVEVRRACGDLRKKWGAQLYGRYTFVPYGHEFDRSSMGSQAVIETQSDYYNGTRFDGRRATYETYSVAQSGRFDLNLYEFAMGAESSLQLTRRCQLAFGAGLLLGVADWTASRIDEWTQRSDGETVDWAQLYGTGQELMLGATTDLRIRWLPRFRSPWFLEAGAGHVYYGPLRIDAPSVAADFDLSAFNATVGIGFQ